MNPSDIINRSDALLKKYAGFWGSKYVSMRILLQI